LKDYALTGWTGHVPTSCQNTIVPIPANYGKFLWGWPTKLEARFAKAGSTLILLGPHSKGNAGNTGIDRLDQIDLIPEGFKGYVWTNKIEAVGSKAAPAQN
jgi:glycerophosphoryl diester phosphodiesterase